MPRGKDGEAMVGTSGAEFISSTEGRRVKRGWRSHRGEDKYTPGKGITYN